MAGLILGNIGAFMQEEGLKKFILNRGGLWVD
jgi:hypothetical protein